MTTYNRFAYVYDKLMEHAPYKAWTNFTLQQISIHNKEVQNIVDLGCGTGVITVNLAKLGFDVIGIDFSSDMLTAAADRALKANVDVSWIHQDIRNMEGFTKVDLFVSYCDVMNYIVKKEELISVFNRVYNSLLPEGMFIFDVHSMNYANNYLRDETFSEVTEELVYIWDCEQGELPGEMFHYLTFFQKEDEKYIRFDEMHHQQTYELNVYTQLLKRSGFSKIHFYADFNIENDFSEKNSERIFIVAEK
ncbi:class I SAM-dependent DNA methyltransferase [Pseudogracilibacillus sp. SO30301A]|uniref:class I SAM-dependent DNA methyltransferase n=1 Tax=Pseudogracilibacillus sp. SO30301A TaxID=3098291 RepID=UPI00300DE0B2